ncbi:hypothetical protein [Bacillus sp. 1NLA3E]|uniref:hypothetical protein n=1 Tax=Bacillus sp. 1NLA3E TaxID=666686 RepID=UPI000247EAF5|nr:hypothetical protein [Bacillus sp. 1NLA3E]AGK53172.1 hypothetical protein B1NLA3E_07040 [Bacillus sp. 1NLA3E]
MELKNFIDIIINSNKEDWKYDDDFGRYIYIHDIRISIISDRNFDETYENNWLNCFPDKKGYYNRYYLCFNGATIESFYAVAVDGYRMIIPSPRLMDLSISLKQKLIGKIINKPYTEVIDQYDDYLNMAGISIRDED